MKHRADYLLHQQGHFPSRERAHASILAGEVFANGKLVQKPGQALDERAHFLVTPCAPRFASRGGEKLLHALKDFGVSPEGLTCMDVGSSHGGFTDCLLQLGACHVYAIDVGRGQLEDRLRRSANVTLYEGENIRFTLLDEKISKPLNLICIDVSFISLRTVLENLKPQVTAPCQWILLFKPQFEVGKREIKKGGLPRSEQSITQALNDFEGFCTKLLFQKIAGPNLSILTGKKSGNVEYFFHYA